MYKSEKFSFYLPNSHYYILYDYIVRGGEGGASSSLPLHPRDSSTTIPIPPYTYRHMERKKVGLCWLVNQPKKNKKIN